MLLWICSFSRLSTALAISAAVLSLCWRPRLPCFDCSGLRDYCHLPQFTISCTSLFFLVTAPDMSFCWPTETQCMLEGGFYLMWEKEKADWLILQNNHKSQPLCDLIPRNNMMKRKMTQIIKTCACKNSIPHTVWTFSATRSGLSLSNLYVSFHFFEYNIILLHLTRPSVCIEQCHQDFYIHSEQVCVFSIDLMPPYTDSTSAHHNVHPFLKCSPRQA